MFKSTPDQWLLLKSVVELGSVAKAAAAHNRSQPAVSYQLQQLQEQLGVTLLSLAGRQLKLTPTGRVLLEQATVMLDGWQRLELQAQALARGERTVLSLVVDSIFPKHWLASSLKQFHEHYPQVQVHIKEVVRDESLNHLQQHSGDLYLISLPEHTTIEKQWVMDIQFLLVASGSHELFNVPAALRNELLSTIPLLQVIDQEQQQQAIAHSWYFTSIESAIEAVRSELGYGWLPAQNIQPQLASGELRPVDMQLYPPRLTRLYLVNNDDEARHDPAVALLQQILLANVQPEPSKQR